MFLHRRGCPLLGHRAASKVAVQSCHRRLAVLVKAAPHFERTPAALDPGYQFGDEALLGFDERKPILVLDEKQGWEILNRRVGGLPFEFGCQCLDPRQALAQERERFIRRQNRQQAERCFKLRIFLNRLANEISHPGAQFVTSCRGLVARIGTAFRGSVVRRDFSRERTTWIASINSTGLGEFLEWEIAMRRVEELVESSMMLALHDYIRQQKGDGNVR
jgi:hypothetical protein